MENLGGLENRVGAVCDPGIGMHVAKSVPDLVDIDAVRTGTVTQHIDGHRVEGDAENAREGQQMN